VSKESIHLNNVVRNSIGFQKHLTPAVLLGFILLLGIVLRFYDLGAESYAADEMSTVFEGQQSVYQIISSGRLDQPPAYYLPYHIWVQLFGDEEVSTRMFSALIGIGSIILIYMIGREMFVKSVGLLSAFLMSITEFQIFYSQISRFYSFFEFMTLLSFLFFILAFRSKKTIYFCLYVLASITMVYVHTYGIFILVAQNLVIFIQAIKSRNLIAAWLICQIFIGLAVFPYLIPLLLGNGGIKAAIDLNITGYFPPSILSPLRSIYLFVFSPRRERSWEIMLINYTVSGGFLVVVTLVYSIRQGKNNFITAARGLVVGLQEVPALTSKVFLLSCWLLCPIVLPFVASLVIGPMYQDHYTISAAPALYLLIALGIYSIRKLVPLIVPLGVFAIMIGPSLGYYYATDIHPEWREVATYINEKSSAGDVIEFVSYMVGGIQQRTFNWYYRGTLHECTLDSKLIELNAISEPLNQCISGHDRLWVIIPTYANSTFDDRIRSYFLNSDHTARHLITELQYVGISVYLFELVK
jgi:4-amino-4-deoxy-L-arabinose transferase-like glycosyltransferase